MTVHGVITQTWYKPYVEYRERRVPVSGGLLQIRQVLPWHQHPYCPGLSRCSLDKVQPFQRKYHSMNRRPGDPEILL